MRRTAASMVIHGHQPGGSSINIGFILPHRGDAHSMVTRCLGNPGESTPPVADRDADIVARFKAIAVASGDVSLESAVIALVEEGVSDTATGYLQPAESNVNLSRHLAT